MLNLILIFYFGNVVWNLELALAACGVLCALWVCVKKTTKYSERIPTKRIEYLGNLRRLALKYGTQNIVYFDESGFEAESYRPHGWAIRGTKIFGDISGNNRKKTNLIMAQRGKEWLAPMLFEGSCETATVNYWLESMLLPELKEPSIIVMDNARFHNKKRINEILTAANHVLLPLPKYSPDFNPIERSFATLKKRRQFLPKNTTIDQLIMGNY
jgi:putative transposase